MVLLFVKLECIIFAVLVHNSPLLLDDYYSMLTGLNMVFHSSVTKNFILCRHFAQNEV
jgi:hypothetical protein